GRVQVDDPLVERRRQRASRGGLGRGGGGGRRSRDSWFGGRGRGGGGGRRGRRGGRRGGRRRRGWGGRRLGGGRGWRCCRGGTCGSRGRRGARREQTTEHGHAEPEEPSDDLASRQPSTSNEYVVGVNFSCHGWMNLLVEQMCAHPSRSMWDLSSAAAATVG